MNLKDWIGVLSFVMVLVALLTSIWSFVVTKRLIRTSRAIRVKLLSIEYAYRSVSFPGAPEHLRDAVLYDACRQVFDGVPPSASSDPYEIPLLGD